MTLAVTVAYAAPGVEAIVPVTLPAGATVADAVEASGVLARCGLAPSAIGYAIHGQRAAAHTPVADGDRVELTRPLVADAGQARRARAQERPLPKAPPRTRKRR